MATLDFLGRVRLFSVRFCFAGLGEAALGWDWLGYAGLDSAELGLAELFG